ncbi:MAG: hydrogenase maturation protease [Candidatus Thermoplasmatota archaeon]|nr:hydrogenase maturation protease [Candidatus Thermoplasmatota archaeon]
MKRTIIVGIGNPILGDDGVGIHVVRQLKSRSDVDVREAYTGGMNLLDMILGYDRAILVDAVYLKDMDVGDVRVMDLDELGTAHSTSPHDATLMEAVELSGIYGEERVPNEITLVGIRIDRVEEFSDELSVKIGSAIPQAVDIVKGLLGS